MNAIRTVILFYIVAMLILSFIPAWHSFIASSTSHMDANLSLVVNLLADPAEYVWKWIVVVLVLVLARR